ncbi:MULTISPECIES: nucleotide sugar dehydrogenase [Olivibacter]|jgi:UDP-N-acetyl-D-galactosamine dehydrogenase|uniref:Nucleotide sugar dehydrogenase n=1 Tax=Olivibacter oleidegradans TaxID=760123 RepID=A0ABV6HGA8_9SPHI|nr:nucleotide sugar dehydrogenase [Olivibacter jilunii]
MDQQHLDSISNYQIAIIGLGYVGLPLAIEFGRKYDVLGFDINKSRVNELREGIDYTRQANIRSLFSVLKRKQAPGKNGEHIGLSLSSDKRDLIKYNVFIVTVPTPIDRFKVPDLRPLIHASEMLGEILKKGDIVIYESTVYPGCTEEVCIPVLERISGLCLNTDFYVGYSPERINPGDKINTVTRIIKVTSGSCADAAYQIDSLYKSVIKAGTYRAPTIKVAEAAKAIENAQRDVNISFVNELALIFDRMGIDTNEVLEAAATKFNFLKYKPGLVGGHCISVDPYYLAHKATQLGYYPEVILSGRRVNDSMSEFIVSKVIKLMIAKGQTIKDANALILGITFKENCPDIRNTKVVDIYTELVQYGIKVDVFDPWADAAKVKDEYNIDIFSKLIPNKKYGAILLTVAHDEFRRLNIIKLKEKNAIVFDSKAFLDRAIVDCRL